MSWFKKATKGAGNFFKKVGSGAVKTFKKGGYLDKGLAIGDKVLSAVEKSPLGAALTPFTSVARAGLNIGNRLSGVASSGLNALSAAKDGIKSGQKLGDVAQNFKNTGTNLLEKAKVIKEDAKAIKYA